MERGKMDASTNSGIPVPQLLCLSLHECDKIRVTNLAATLIPAVRTVIQLSWKYGIQSEKMHGTSYQFKLRGRPWDGDGEQAHCARQLMAGVFGFLLQNGWLLRVSTDLSMRGRDKETFYFKQEAHPNPSARVCAMSFNMYDTIRVISGPPEVTQVVRACIRNFWYPGMQRECLCYGEPEFKLVGDPWICLGTESRTFVGQLIEALDDAGWLVYASTVISTGRDESTTGDLDSWILRSKSPPPDVPVVGIPAQKQVPYNWL